MAPPGLPQLPPGTPSKERRKGHIQGEVGPNGGFYFVLEMDKWSDDLVARLIETTHNHVPFGPEFGRTMFKLLQFYNGFRSVLEAMSPADRDGALALERRHVQAAPSEEELDRPGPSGMSAAPARDAAGPSTSSEISSAERPGSSRSAVTQPVENGDAAVADNRGKERDQRGQSLEVVRRVLPRNPVGAATSASTNEARLKVKREAQEHSEAGPSTSGTAVSHPSEPATRNDAVHPTANVSHQSRVTKPAGVPSATVPVPPQQTASTHPADLQGPPRHSHVSPTKDPQRIRQPSSENHAARPATSPVAVSRPSMPAVPVATVPVHATAIPPPSRETIAPPMAPSSSSASAPVHPLQITTTNASTHAADVQAQPDHLLRVKREANDQPDTVHHPSAAAVTPHNPPAPPSRTASVHSDSQRSATVNSPPAPAVPPRAHSAQVTPGQVPTTKQTPSLPSSDAAHLSLKRIKEEPIDVPPPVPAQPTVNPPTEPPVFDVAVPPVSLVTTPVLASPPDQNQTLATVNPGMVPSAPNPGVPIAPVYSGTHPSAAMYSGYYHYSGAYPSASMHPGTLPVPPTVHPTVSPGTLPAAAMYPGGYPASLPAAPIPLPPQLTMPTAQLESYERQAAFPARSMPVYNNCAAPIIEDLDGVPITPSVSFALTSSAAASTSHAHPSFVVEQPPQAEPTPPESSRIDQTTIEKLIAAHLDALSTQIIHANSIKQMVFSSKFDMGDVDPTLLTADSWKGSPLKLDTAFSEHKKIKIAVEAVECQLNMINVPSDNYFRVSNLQVQEELDNLWDKLKDDVEKELERQREANKVALEKAKQAAEKAALEKLRAAQKRVHPEPNEPPEHHGSPSSKRSKQKRDHSSDHLDHPRPSSSSRVRRHSETEHQTSELGRWCHFCKRMSDHVAVNCSVYKTHEARIERKNELKLCHHCLDTYNPYTCKEPEHRVLCPHCQMHTTHPALCKFLLEADLSGSTHSSPTRGSDRRDRGRGRGRRGKPFFGKRGPK